MDEEEQKKRIQEIEQEISNAIQRLCILAHDCTGRSMVLAHVIHVSDALTQSGTTQINVVYSGEHIERASGPEASKVKVEHVDPAQAADNIVEAMMKKAKEIQGGLKPEEQKKQESGGDANQKS